MNKKLVLSVIAGLGLGATSVQAASSGAGSFDFWGHFGVDGSFDIGGTKSDSYSGLSGSIGFDAPFGSGFAVGLGGWAGITIYEQTKNYADDNVYKHYFILSDAYFAYTGDIFYITLGRYSVNNMTNRPNVANMGYDWFSGHNQGVSLGFNIGNFMTIWGLYSHQQAFQFQRYNRETFSQTSALWDFRGHQGTRNGRTTNQEHLGAIGIDFKAGDIFRITPYVYYVSNDLVAPGATAKLTLGQHTDLYSDTTLKYVYVDENQTNRNGQLFLVDQEFGYSWFRIGGGYYYTTGNGANALTRYGDDSRFYGGIVQATFYNKAAGDYYGADESTWYVFAGARHDVFKFDLLYANGSYKELSALFSVTLFQHLDFGAGYIDLANVNNNKRNYVTAFVKAIW